MSNLKKFAVAVATMLGIALPAHAQTDLLSRATCTGEFFNPVTDADWQNVFPVTLGSVRYTQGSRSNPAIMEMNTVCTCPTILGAPMVGVTVSYWQPQYVAEIEHRPGCSATLGGVQLISGYRHKMSEEADDGSETSQTNLKQIHWYEYPLMQYLEWFKSFWCHAPSGFNLLYLTEFDPTWNDDEFGLLLAPESSLFASTPAQAACAVDAVASNLRHPMDSLFWCAGSWGSVYPLSGNAPISNNHNQVNNLVLAKFMARNARLGLAWQTIGPAAMCSSLPSPIWIKSQYRINQIGPVARKGNAQTIGDIGGGQFPPAANAPTREHTSNLVWQAQQCCLKPVP